MAGVGFPGIDIEAAVSGRLQDLFNRAPRHTDDITAGYAVDDLWMAKQRVWRCARNDAGKAVWLVDRASASMSIPALPMDVTTGCIAGYGARKMKAAYSSTGALYDVERDSDGQAATLSMINGELDTAAADLNGLGSVNRITQWYDQSGSAYHATATGDERPLLPPIATLGNRRGVLFDNSLTSNGSLDPRQGLTIPAGVTTSSQSITVIAYYHPRHSFADQPIVEMAGPSAGQYMFFGIRAQTGSYGVALRGAKSQTSGVAGTAIEPRVYAFTSSASNTVIYQPDAAPASTTYATSYTLAGGKIGWTDYVNYTGSTPARGGGTLGALLIYNRALSAAEIAAVTASIDFHYGSRVQARGNIVCSGDSITNGSRGTYFLSWPRQLALVLSRSARIYNLGISGGTIQTMTDSVASWTGIYNSAAPFNRYVLCVGTNDLGNDGTAAGMKILMETHLETVRSGRDWDDIWLGTVLPRGLFNSNPSTSGAQWLLWNDVVRDNAAAWGVKVIDFNADPTFSDTNVVNGSLFGDSTHPNVDGLGYMANIIRPHIDF